MTDKETHTQEGSMEVYSTGGQIKLTQAIRAVILARKLSKSQMYNTVSSQDPLFIGVVAYIISKLLKTKLLVSVFGMNVFSKGWLKEKWFNRFIKPISIFILSQATALQTDTMDSFSLLQKKYKSKTFYKLVIPTNLKDFDVNRDYHGEGRKVLYVGRLSHEKNIPFLVEVIKSTAQKIPSIHFTVIGNGPLRSYFLAQINKNELTKFVTYIPELSRKEIVSYFQNNDIFILTSFYEGLAKVFMEAGMSGMPIVTTDVGGARDIIEHGKTGYIVSHGDTLEMTERIYELCNDPILRMWIGQKLQNVARQKFSFDAMIEDQRNVYEYLSHAS